MCIRDSIPAFYSIQEHRHDFHTKIKVNGQSLKNYWRAEYDQFLEESQVPVVSLLSSEFEDVFSPTLRKQLFTVSFMEDRNGVLKTHSTICLLYTSSIFSIEDGLECYVCFLK